MVGKTFVNYLAEECYFLHLLDQLSRQGQQVGDIF